MEANEEWLARQYLRMEQEEVEQATAAFLTEHCCSCRPHCVAPYNRLILDVGGHTLSWSSLKDRGC